MGRDLTNEEFPGITTPGNHPFQGPFLKSLARGSGAAVWWVAAGVRQQERSFLRNRHNRYIPNAICPRSILSNSFRFCGILEPAELYIQAGLIFRMYWA